MRVGRSYKQTKIGGPYDAIVIGSGIGGLTTASLLAGQAQKRVLVLEQHYTAGGFTQTFNRPGYEWDVGVHYVGDMHRENSYLGQCLNLISDGTLQWAAMPEAYDRVIVDGDVYDFVAGQQPFIDQMTQYFPQERRAIESYVDRIISGARMAVMVLAPRILPRAARAVLGPMMQAQAARGANRTTKKVLGSLTDNARLRAVLAGQWGDYGLPPAQSSFLMHAVVARHYLDGAAYPVGGASRIAASIVPQIEKAGGLVLTNASVTQIIVQSGRAGGVRLQSGEEILAPIVISNAGAKNTYDRLISPSESAPKKIQQIRTKLAQIPPSVAHISLYIGLNKSDADLGTPKNNHWIYGDDDHDRAMQRIADDPTAPLPVVYISFPSAKDPDFQRRHPGHATVEAITFVPVNWFEKWSQSEWQHRGTEYEEFKKHLSERILKVVYENVPQLRGAVSHAELSTPLSTQHFTGHPSGSIYGLAHTPARFSARWLRPATPIRGLYLTGSDVGSCGVGGAMIGGLLCASAVLNKNLFLTVRAAQKSHKDWGKWQK